MRAEQPQSNCHSARRKLRLVLVNGKSVGDTLVDEGLARYYRGGKKSWC
jgi:hypothetical protein